MEFYFKKNTLFILFFLYLSEAFSVNQIIISKDSLKDPKHYFQTKIYLNYYTTPRRNLRVLDVSSDKRILNRKVLYRQEDAYQYSQSNVGVNAPFYTRIKKDENGLISSTTYLITGSLLSAMPYLKSLNTNHIIYRGSMGVRAIYSSVGKNTWYFDLFGFAAEDNKSIKIPNPRFGATLILNRTVNEYFSYRIGITRTFLFGNWTHLPIFGIRVGRLDGLNLSAQLPRNISLNFPVSSKSAMSIYFKPFGGIYNFKNSDTLFNRRASIIQFRRLDYLLGTNFSSTVNNHFSYFISGGIAAGGFAFAENKSAISSTLPFFKARATPSLFFNAGICISLGRSKKSDNDIKMMDIKDLNNVNDAGDINSGTGENQSKKKTSVNNLSNIKYKDVEDLISESDF